MSVRVGLVTSHRHLGGELARTREPGVDFAGLGLAIHAMTHLHV